MASIAARRRSEQSGSDQPLKPSQIAANTIGAGLPGLPDGQQIAGDLNVEIGNAPFACPAMMSDVRAMSWSQINHVARVYNATFNIVGTGSLPEMRGKFRAPMMHGERDD